MKTSPLLEFKNITVIKGGKRVLDSISISVNKGENIAILGPNGAGKSSFIKVITREYYPLPDEDSSCFKMLGHDIWNIFDLRNLLGIVSNDLQYTFTRDITGFDVVLSGFFSAVGLFNEKITQKMVNKAKKIIDFLEISHLKNRLLDEMSSGEARRFLIGRALVHDPKALILDEPANSLDMHAFYKFSNILRKIAKSGVSIILVTQNLHDVIPEIDRIILMKEGRFIEDGHKKDILNDKNISNLYEIPIEIISKNGYYYALRA